MSLDTLTQPEFDTRREANELAITLVGMSNLGKSFWANRLVDELGFDVIGCDDLIETELKDVLETDGFEGGISDMARWMGQPYDSRFASRQQTYLDLETITMKKIIDQLSHPPLNGNVVVDTTGSVIHTSEEICHALKVHSTVVHLEATPEMQRAMFELYMAEPKPVVWGDAYRSSEEQTSHETLEACYPQLLGQRCELYRKMAQVTLARETTLALENGEMFLDYVRNSLPII